MMNMEKKAYNFWEWVQARMTYLEIPSFRELERKAGLSNGSISSRKNDLKLPTVEMAVAMCDALDVTWLELWEQAGIVNKIEPNQLTGLDAKIYQALQGTSNDFKQATLETIKAWLICEKTKK